MLYPFSQIISLSYSACADDMGHLERTEQKISLATGVACFLFFCFFFLLPQHSAQPGTFYRCKRRILRQEKTRLVPALIVGSPHFRMGLSKDLSCDKGRSKINRKLYAPLLQRAPNVMKVVEKDTQFIGLERVL